MAVLLLLIASAANINALKDGISADQESGISTNADGAAGDNVINASGKTSNGLNLGLMLFRRG